MSATPFFSVIIPTYNRAHTIKTTVDSVLHQTFTDFELIVVDDGSTDNTKLLIQQYTDERIKYYYQENQERSIARNNGVKLSRGAYICLLDSDDIFYPNHLQVFYEGIQKAEDKNSVFRTGLVVNNGQREIKMPNYDPRVHGQPVKFAWEEWVGIHDFCFPKEVVEQFPFVNLRKWQDIHFFIRVLYEYPMIQLSQYTHCYNSVFNADKDLTPQQIQEDLNTQLQCLIDLKNTNLPEIDTILGPNAFEEKKLNLIISAAYNAMRIKCYMLGLKLLLEDLPEVSLSLTNPRLILRYIYYLIRLKVKTL